MNIHNMRVSRSVVTIEQQTQECYVVWYDKEVLVGLIYKNKRRYHFYPDNKDALSSLTLKAITDKLDELNIED